MVGWTYEGYLRLHFPLLWFQRQVPFLSRVSFYRKLLSSQTLSSLHTYLVGQLCLDVHHRTNLFQANSHFGTDREFWLTKPWSNPACQTNTRRLLFSQCQLLTVKLLALPITACGLRLDDEAVRTAVAPTTHMGTTFCVPHTCPRGAQVDAYGVHRLVCKRASAKITRHQALDDVIASAFGAADMQVTKEPKGLSISDNKRPDGLTLSPWQDGKPIT